ncbi:RNA polymerase II holoenzyme and mediator subcomplex, subunit SURB7/SRB7 [Handroanthus impetiginosus]|uniref:Mediator of RNA polymerase II transcription subunit 21 n=1 Tax=Handroanthus impetiginosus TaxID=429701 RepID=A0A2G9HUH8_9LAMI|nr:RNA polymerase II holoenzyme and mediator subcomplex, subunit SURB7/SRB7 [Handroanthus impetiginosus]
MDIISQLQEQVNTIASLAFNTFGTLQRDAPPVQLSPNYPEPPANASAVEDAANISEQPKLLSAELVKAAKQFDALVAALPLSEGGEEAQLKRIAELQVQGHLSSMLIGSYTRLIMKFWLDYLHSLHCWGNRCANPSASWFIHHVADCLFFSFSSSSMQEYKALTVPRYTNMLPLP